VLERILVHNLVKVEAAQCDTFVCSFGVQQVLVLVLIEDRR
jgi:hypothetical protein